MTSKIRIYYPEGKSHHPVINRNLVLEEQRHYLVNVHRVTVDSLINIFNSTEGEFVFKIEHIDKKHVYCTCVGTVNLTEKKQLISVAIPLIKPSRLEWTIEKVTEIGVNTIYLLHTNRSVKRNPNVVRLHDIMCSALQQSRRVKLPKLVGPLTLDELMKHEQNLIVAHPDGTRGVNIATTGPVTLVVGPEGCFTPHELDLLGKFPKLQIMPDCVLRSDTAAIAGLILLKGLA